VSYPKKIEGLKNIRIDTTIQLTEEENQYLEACARMRRISKSKMVRRLLKVIMEDQMIASVMDDADKLVTPRVFISGADRPPATDLWDGLK
jgi:hypothetical protein